MTVEGKMLAPAPAGDAAVSPAAGDSTVRDLQERFVLHWGELASAWGINRTMGQIHALLYISPEPLSMDDIIERLKISRGSASMNLRALEDWGVIQRLHFTGDRREYFRSLTDVWELFNTILRERKRREFDPLLRSLQQFLGETSEQPADPGVADFRDRLVRLLTVLEQIQTLCDRLMPRDPREVSRLLEVNVEGLE